MVPARIEAWRIYAGDDAQVTLTLTVDGVPADLSGWGEWRAAWRVRPGVGVPVELVVDVSRVSEGVVVVRVPGALSAVDGGVVRSGVWDLQARREGETKTFVRGSVEWVGDVTP